MHILQSLFYGRHIPQIPQFFPAVYILSLRQLCQLCHLCHLPPLSPRLPILLIKATKMQHTGEKQGERHVLLQPIKP